MPVLEKDDKKNRAFGPRKNSEWIREVEEACAIEPKRSFKLQYILISFVLLSVFLLSSCTSLEVGVHYGKMAYNKCSDLDNWQCLWYDK